jgi:hypothetical protein
VACCLLAGLFVSGVLKKSVAGLAAVGASGAGHAAGGRRLRFRLPRLR